MSCAYRSHRYRSSVTACPALVSWQPPTGHAQHPIPLRLPVGTHDWQAVPETGTSTDDAPIPVSLIQYLWSQWYEMTPADRGAVVEVIGTLMRSPPSPNHLYGYLSPLRFPDIAEETHRLLRATSPDDQYKALTVLTQWLASSDHATRTVAARMLHGWPYVVAALVRDFPSDLAIREVLDRLVPTILTFTGSDDRIRWAATLWDLMTDSTLSDKDERRQIVAAALQHHMMRDPMVAALVHALLRARLSPQRITTEPVWDPLLATLIRTVCADEVLRMIEQALATVRATMGTDHDPIIRRFDPILAAGWGNGHDHRILQIIDSAPGPHWETVLFEGITTSVGDVVCDRIQAWFPHDQAFALIVHHIRAREERGDWPLAPLPAHLIPWVGAAARTCPYDLHPTTIRRLWLADPDDAWDVTQTMLHADDPSVQRCAIAAMDAGWGTGHDVAMATILRSIILNPQNDPSVVSTGTTTAITGIGAAPPSLIAALLTELATTGHDRVQYVLIRDLHCRWGRGQDALVMRIVQTIADRASSEQVWSHGRITLARAWHYQPPQVVLSLVDRLLTHALHRVVHDEPCVAMAATVIYAIAYGWRWLPLSQIIPFITQHVSHLCRVAHTLDPDDRGHLVFTWASAIAAGMERLSAADIHAVLDPLWKLDPILCCDGVREWFRRYVP